MSLEGVSEEELKKNKSMFKSKLSNIMKDQADCFDEMIVSEAKVTQPSGPLAPPPAHTLPFPSLTTILLQACFAHSRCPRCRSVRGYPWHVPDLRC